MNADDLARFMSKVRTPAGVWGCWEWAGWTRSGYGRFDIGHRQHSAHRLAYEHVVGSIPEGLVLDHLCRVRHCVNPLHLEAVTNAENVLRGTSFSALNAQKDVCAKGHDFTAENTYLRPRGGRECRICLRDRANRYRRRQQSTASRGPSRLAA